MVKSVSLWLKGEFDVIQAPISLPHTAGIVFFLPKKVLKRKVMQDLRFSHLRTSYAQR